jgi:hypothetical protein
MDVFPPSVEVKFHQGRTRDSKRDEFITLLRYAFEIIVLENGTPRGQSSFDDFIEAFNAHVFTSPRERFASGNAARAQSRRLKEDPHIAHLCRVIESAEAAPERDTELDRLVSLLRLKRQIAQFDLEKEVQRLLAQDDAQQNS